MSLDIGLHAGDRLFLIGLLIEFGNTSSFSFANFVSTLSG
jgi:hypothetical protein